MRIGETAENALHREVLEELNITAKISRFLWLNQTFFKAQRSLMLINDTSRSHLHDVDKQANEILKQIIP